METNRFFFRPSTNRRRERDPNPTLPSIDWLSLALLPFDVLWEAKDQDFMTSHGKEYTWIVRQNRKFLLNSSLLRQFNSEILLSIIAGFFMCADTYLI